MREIKINTILKKKKFEKSNYFLKKLNKKRKRKNEKFINF